jgi:hypothetical protein
MLDDFKRALARVQSDYGFYVDCQASPALALAGYDLTPDERSVLSDPVKLADVLGRVGINPLRITVTISGKHDWVNRTRPKKTAMTDVDRDARVATEVEAIRKASTDKERNAAAVRLMELIG